MNGMYHYWGMGFAWIIWPVLLAILVWLIVRSVNHRRGPEPGGKSALDILKERYARGEISKEEYEQKRKDIT
ncbi:MAG: SHOCT domain-containing protein [Bacteroidales bacterium]